MENNYFKNRKVLVTGAGGFIASHLAEMLVSLNADVRAMVHYNAMGKAGWLDTSPEKSKMEIVAGDITDRDCLLEFMHDREIVFHLASLIAIPYSYRAPSSYVRTNIGGALNIMQSAKELGNVKIIHTSTSEVYGSAQYVPIDEKHPLVGQSPYSASKIGADKIVESFNLSFGVPTVTIRPFNTFGPRQSQRAVIPTIIIQCLQGNEIHLGATSPTRDLNYVENTVNGFIQAAVSEQAIGKTINLGSNREISIGNLAELIGQLMGKDIRIISDDLRKRPKDSEVKRLLADATLAKELLGWEPEYTLEEGLEKTITWIKLNQGIYSADEYII